MANTYSSRPFVSHDGPDTNGFRAEVKVVTGFGHVDSIEKSKAGKSAKVSFKVENTDFLSAGWAPIEDPVMKLVEEAKDSGEPIHFRIETRRQDKIDRATPIAELTDLSRAKDSIHKSLSAVKREDDSAWTISPHAKTNMAEDPVFGAKSANDFTLEELRAGKAGSASSAPARVSHRGVEPPPYVARLASGAMNPGSMAVAAPLNIYTFLAEYLKDKGIEVDDRTKFATVKVILAACNDAQLGIYETVEEELSNPDLSLGSHTRARALIFESVRIFYPLTAEVMSDAQALEEWKTATVEKVLKMWQWAMKETNAIEN